MGWLIIIALRPMLTMIPVKLAVSLFSGGIFYTFGIIFYAWKKCHTAILSGIYLF